MLVSILFHKMEHWVVTFMGLEFLFKNSADNSTKNDSADFLLSGIK